MFKILIVLKKEIFMDNNDIPYDSFTLLFFAKIYIELDILPTFHDMIFKSDLELYIK